MAFEVPGLFGKVELDIAPLKRGFAQAKAESALFSGNIAPELTKTLSIDVAPAVQNLQKLESEVKARVDRMQEKLFAAPAQQMQHLLPGPVQQFQKLLPGPGDLTASSVPAHIAAPSVAVDVAPLKAGLDQAKAEVEKFSATVAPELHQKLTLDTGGGVDKLEQLKAEFQAQTDSMKAEASALQGRLAARQAEISSGGMSASQTGFAIAGLSIAAHQVDELAQKAEKVALQFQAGEISGRELTAQLLRSVPIAGDLGDAMSRVYSFLDGDTQYVAEINRQLAAQEVHMHNLNAAAAETKKWTEQTADLVGQVQIEIKALSLSGVPLKLFEIDADIQAKIEAIKKQLPTIHADSNKAFTAEILANKAETQKLYGQLDAKAADLNRLIGTDDHPLSVPDLLSRKIPMEGIGVNANAVQSDLRDLNGRIQTFNEKNRKLREQITKDETSAAADA
jgi:hypothetical protein